MLDRVPRAASPERAAQILFPNNPAAQQDYIEHTRALPVALAVVIPILTRCVLGALSGVALQELYYAAARKENFKVEDLIDGAVTGCIGTVLPPLVRDAANRAKRPLVAAIAAAIVWLSSKS